MTKDVVRARIDPELKREATAVLNDMGLSVSDAIRLMLLRVVEDRAIPFELRVPNATTRRAMQAARDGEVVEFASTSRLFADLHDDEE